MADDTRVGTIGWIDMTTEDADGLRDFYQAVVGWRVENVGMGDYDDYSMTTPSSGEAVAGICHALGSNADLPPGWLIYIEVSDLEASMAECSARGGQVVRPPRPLAGGRFCVIEDPSGATAALFQPPPE